MNDESGCKLRHLSECLVTAQRPIRVLEALRWPAEAEAQFHTSGCRNLPHVPPESYRPLAFDPTTKVAELAAIGHAARRLGGPAAELLARRCDDYRSAVRLLLARGTREFAALSFGTYGRLAAADDERIRGTLAAMEHILPPEPTGDAVPAEIAACDFATRLARSLPVWATARVMVTDAMPSDAAAGCTYVKLRRGATFTPADLDLLEVHEGWVHLGTTLNGRAQPRCTFLAKGPPSTSCTQEGLAVLCELLAGTSNVGRIRRLARRYNAVRAAMAGADFRDVYRSLLDATGDPRSSFQQAARVFRGCPPDHGPYAKDLGYTLGLTQLLRAVQVARDPLDLGALFAGKLALADRPLLVAALADGSIVPPAFLPPPVACRATLARRLAALPHLGHRRTGPHRFDESRRMPLVPTPARYLSCTRDTDASP